MIAVGERRMCGLTAGHLELATVVLMILYVLRQPVFLALYVRFVVLLAILEEAVLAGRVVERAGFILIVTVARPALELLDDCSVRFLTMVAFRMPLCTLLNAPVLLPH